MSGDNIHNSKRRAHLSDMDNLLHFRIRASRRCLQWRRIHVDSRVRSVRSLRHSRMLGAMQSEVCRWSCKALWPGLVGVEVWLHSATNRQTLCIYEYGLCSAYWHRDIKRQGYMHRSWLFLISASPVKSSATVSQAELTATITPRHEPYAVGVASTTA